MSLLATNLQTFMAIVSRGTVHGAAADVHLTQTGVTQRIRSLENELGATLFLRSRQGMKLTPEGEALLRYCRSAIELEGVTLSHLQKAGSESPISLTIAGPTSAMASRVAAACEKIYKDWPKLQLNLVVTDHQNRLNLVRTGDASLAIVSPEQVPFEMESKRLKPDKYCLVASAAWKGRSLGDVLANERVIDFDEQDPTTLNYLRKFKLLEQLKRPRLYVNSNEIIINFFRRAIGFGTLTHDIAKPFLDSGELITLNNGAVLEDLLALVWYARPQMSPYFQTILKAIK